jgi:hypothetical protein
VCVCTALSRGDCVCVLHSLERDCVCVLHCLESQCVFAAQSREGLCVCTALSREGLCVCTALSREALCVCTAQSREALSRVRSRHKLKYRGTDKSLAQPGEEQTRKHVRDARDFNNIETRAVIKFFFFSANQGAEGNSHHSDRNVSLSPSLLDYPFKFQVKSHVPLAGIIRSSPYSPR